MCLIPLQLSYEQSDKFPNSIQNLKSIPLNELSTISQKLLSLPDDEQQVHNNSLSYFILYFSSIIPIYSNG